MQSVSQSLFDNPGALPIDARERVANSTNLPAERRAELMRYDRPCRKARREAHKLALQQFRRGATSCGPSWPSGTPWAAGLIGAFERQPTQAVTSGARESVDALARSPLQSQESALRPESL